MKKLLLIIAVLASFTMVGCAKVPAGHVAVKVNLYGSDKGVLPEVVGTGRYWKTPNTQYYLFPTFSQNYVWTSSKVEGSREDESLTFGTVEGLSIGADIGITYFIEPDSVATVFQKYRKGVDEITDIYLRNMVRDALVKEASSKPVESIYGVGKADLIEAVEERVRNQVAEIGINIERIYWIGAPRLPEQVVRSINAKIEATQIAMKRENEVQTAKAQAAIDVAQAQGQADSQLAITTAKAKGIDLMGEAEARAIRLKAEALAKNAALVDLTYAENWDGKLPTTMIPNSTVPFMDVAK